MKHSSSWAAVLPSQLKESINNRVNRHKDHRLKSNQNLAKKDDAERANNDRPKISKGNKSPYKTFLGPPADQYLFLLHSAVSTAGQSDMRKWNSPPTNSAELCISLRNTIMLRTRTTTHDVDFFHEDYRSPELNLLNEAGQYAISHSQVPLGSTWLNNTTILHVPIALQTRLAREAVQQNEIVFQEPGLTVHAAPWEYALSAKLDRMHKPNRRSYDLDDATIYLRRYIEKHTVPGVSINDVREWAARYGTRATDAVVREIDVHYHEQYRHGGIRW